MKANHLVWLASKNLNRHAFRSFLTILGIIFGVGSLVAMLSIAEGARLKSLEEMSSLAIDNIVIESIKPNKSPIKSEIITENYQRENINYFEYGLTERDLQAFFHFENTKNITRLRNLRKPIYKKGHETSIKVLSTEPQFLNVAKLQLIKGRFLTKVDLKNKSRVCVITSEAAETLFPNRHLLNQKIQIGHSWFDVIGIVKAPSTLKFSFNTNLNNTIYLPFTTSQSIYGTASKTSEQNVLNVEYDALLVQIKDLSNIQNTTKRVKSYLKTTHQNEDYGVTVPYDLVKQKETSAKIFSIIMGTIAGISLLVGGIGVMNIMMANIYERTREIGISLATGAKQKDILFQFLLEALVLSLIGGIMGLVIGIGLSQIVTHWADWKTSVTPLALIGSLIISAGVGLLSGTYPAYKASRLSPIEALRAK